MRLGHGYDVHRLAEGRELIVGGVTIPYEKGLLGHSDADVLAHAVSDALLGAAGLGDIGGMFPDDDPATLGADSLELLRQVAARLWEQGWKPVNIDATVVAQRPKMKPYIAAMRNNLAAAWHRVSPCQRQRPPRRNLWASPAPEKGWPLMLFVCWRPVKIWVVSRCFAYSVVTVRCHQ